VSNAIGYAKHRSHSYQAMFRVYYKAGSLIETHERAVAEAGFFGPSLI
jgi:hypothetical protein